MSKAAYLFNALPTKAVRTIDALREKQEKGCLISLRLAA